MNITIITGWIAAILLAFNFATCLVMPWAQKKIKECKGQKCELHPLCEYHKVFVILSIIASIVHIVVSLVTRLA